ncbi:MAG TPA: hypothetical protein VLQ93_22295 [Myxococcaceae bacterium]|nr:hypothetical protein [Myxococcaceae bacterium]
MADVGVLREFIRGKFCENVGLTQEEVFGADLTLAALVTRSERMTNSVDLMEAFARTANALRKEHGVRVRLPALSLETPVSQVLDVFLKEVQAQKDEGRAA